MSEVQKRRTFEIIGKYFGKESGCTIEYRPDICPQCDPIKKHIILPSNLDEKYLYAGLAGLMHEAGHIRMTNFNPKEIAKDEDEFNILNAIEDVRVDRANFKILPNVKGFYKRFMEYLKIEGNPKNVSPESKVLIDTINECTGFSSYAIGGKETEDFIIKHNMIGKFNEACNAIDTIDYEAVKRIVKEIKDLLFEAKKKKPKPVPKEGETNGSGTKEGKGQEQEGKPKPGPEESQGKQEKKLDLKGVAERGQKSREIFQHCDKKAQGHMISPAQLKEQTRQRFSELLNIKEVKRIDDGKKLDTDNLAAYLTGNIEELLREDIIKRKKKSKIIMVLDCSGSMRERTMSGESKFITLANAAKSIAQMLDEIHSIEGINVDYEVRAFGSDYYKLPKQNWEKDYTQRSDNSTNCARAFTKAQEELLTDYTIDGNKMIILMTDGQVEYSQVEQIHKDILRHNMDVRCMVIGVGADPLDKFMERICSHNILCEDLAETVIIDSIMDMLGG